MDFLETLKDLFPNHTESVIQQVINNVEEELPVAPDSDKIDRMCTLLIENFVTNGVNFSDSSSEEDFENDQVVNLKGQLLRRFPNVCPKFLEDYLNRESVILDYNKIVQYFQMNGYTHKKEKVEDCTTLSKNAELTQQMQLIFPDACENYINECINNGLELDALIDKFTSGDYVKSYQPSTSSSTSLLTNNKMLGDFHQKLCEILPKYDPDFLMSEAKKLTKLNDTMFSQCVAWLLELEEYPTIADYKRRQEKQNKMLAYIFDFKIDCFLKEFSYNLKSFENPKRKHSLAGEHNDLTELENNKRFVSVILGYAYPGIKQCIVDAKLNQFGYNVIQCCDSLGLPQRKQFTRTEVDLPPNSYTNKLLFQELAFVFYHYLIKNYLNIRNESYQKAYKEAEEADQLKTCKTCYEDGLLLMPEECYQCLNGCNFCRQCMIRGCEVAYGDGLIDIACFDDCGAFFSDYILQMVMDPVACMKLMQRKQIKAIREANISDFETCPFCEYGTVVNKSDKVFVCKSEDCGKESCRECQRESHIPFRCNEVEDDEDVRMRTFIENQMTAALIRVCKRCNKQIIKETGCNKMTCVCGQTMCYVCGESGITYKHFEITRCPQQSNQELLHRNNVLQGIQAAKKQLGIDVDPKKLRFDPSEGY